VVRTRPSLGGEFNPAADPVRGVHAIGKEVKVEDSSYGLPEQGELGQDTVAGALRRSDLVVDVSSNLVFPEQ
jgi:hypothetical protein